MRKPNPDYGSGMFRRRMRLRPLARRVEVEIEDNNHGFRLALHHDDKRVTDVVADLVRYPYLTCPEAVQSLRRIVGERLDVQAAQLRERIPPRENCTHLHDMAMLALAHATHSGGERQYDATVVDERAGVIHAHVDCDGERVHDWRIAQGVLQEPARHAGKAMMRGFYAWASAEYSGMALEAALILQRSYFVSQGRRNLSHPAADFPASIENIPDGACYSFNHGVVQRALRMEGSIRDFTRTPELLLQFKATP